jgi:hypothetical protein
MPNELSPLAEAKAIGANIPRMDLCLARVRGCCVIVSVLALAAAIACASDSGSPPARDAASTGTIAYAGELPPLPTVQFASARPAPLTRAAYEFAARHPEVLRHIPCFCGCERNGHAHNEACFVARREADNRPQWSPHGIGCGVCIDVALDAARMHKAGTPVAEIRRAIDEKYKAEYPTSTATPLVHR